MVINLYFVLIINYVPFMISQYLYKYIPFINGIYCLKMNSKNSIKNIENYPFMESMIHPDFHLELVSMAVDILKQRLVNNQIFANRITPK